MRHFGVISTPPAPVHTLSCALQARAFVRASGTEDAVRVYAEAASRSAADSLARQVAQVRVCRDALALHQRPVSVCGTRSLLYLSLQPQDDVATAQKTFTAPLIFKMSIRTGLSPVSILGLRGSVGE